MDSLWSEDIGKFDDGLEAPIYLLRKQARLLGERTKMKVQAEVETDVEYGHDYDTEEPFVVQRDEFKYNFFITSPGIPSYRFRLFSISYGVPFYPVKLDLDSGVAEEINQRNKLVKITSEAQFVDALKEIFNSKKAKQVVQAILAQLQ